MALKAHLRYARNSTVREKLLLREENICCGREFFSVQEKNLLGEKKLHTVREKLLFRRKRNFARVIFSSE